MAKVTRFSRNERQLAKTARLTADDGVRSLLEFVNHSPRPWAKTLPWVREWTTIHHEPLSESELDEAQSQFSADLRRVTERRFTLQFVEPLRVGYAYLRGRVEVFPPDEDLFEFLLWSLLHILAQNRARRLKRCPVCSHFFLAQRSRARFCGPACQDQHFNDQRTKKAHRAKLQRVYGPRHPRQPRKA